MSLWYLSNEETVTLLLPTSINGLTLSKNSLAPWLVSFDTNLYFSLISSIISHSRRAISLTVQNSLSSSQALYLFWPIGIFAMQFGHRTQKAAVIFSAPT